MGAKIWSSREKQATARKMAMQQLQKTFSSGIPHDKETQESEFGNLLKMNDNYRKYVVIMGDYNTHSNYRRVIALNLSAIF
ncbi:MAG: hypothetical protein LBS55_10135 [Prevotellaceae bacterium]|nr:hypothetical protein [Prevotellaceae bacterium]